MKTTLLVLTLNEIGGMKEIMPKVDRSWCEQILVVDGGSKDGTAQWAKEQGYEVYVQKRSGLRHAYIESWPLIKGDVVITFSPDGNSIPELIPPLIAKMKEGCDMVIASRYLPPAKSEDDDLVTGFGNWLFTKTVNVLHGGHYTDAMVMLRAYRTKLFSTEIGVEPLLSVRAAKAKKKVSEIPGDEPPRISGKRKLQILQWGAAYYFQFIRELWFWKPAA